MFELTGENKMSTKEMNTKIAELLRPIQLLVHQLHANLEYQNGCINADKLQARIILVVNRNRDKVSSTQLEKMKSYLDLFLISINELEFEQIQLLYGSLFEHKTLETLAAELSTYKSRSITTIHRRKIEACMQLLALIEFNKTLMP